MKHYIMIGAPITTVRTPPLLTDYLAKQGIDAEIKAHHLEADELKAFMTRVCYDTTIDGLLVTMPHKKAIIPHLEAISPIAKQAGSVNAVKRLRSSKFYGAQFDGEALVDVLQSNGVHIATARVHLAGVGGAGLAIAHAVCAYGCQSLRIVDTNKSLLATTIKYLRDKYPCAVFDTINSRAEPPNVLINATPLGMLSDDPSPFNEELVARATYIVDIVADPPKTKLASMAVDAGATLISGRDVVSSQIALIGRWLLSTEDLAVCAHRGRRLRF